MKIYTKRHQKYHFSPLRYPGGKTFLFPYLDKILNINKLDDITYIEPFAGGAGAAITLLILEKVRDIIINDFDKAVYSFWKSAVFRSDEFIKRMHSTPITINQWKKQRNIYRDKKSDEFDLGFATFYLNRTNVSGILEGGPIGGLNQRGKWKLGARFNKKNLANKIETLKSYRNRIRVFNMDGIKLIDKYLKQKNVFVYLDPPYFDKGATLYLNHYQMDDHKLLAKKLNQFAKSYWLLTYDNKIEIKNLYNQRRRADFSLTYNARNFRRGKEVLIYSEALKVD